MTNPNHRDRGRRDLSIPPPSEPYERVSRIRLSGRWVTAERIDGTWRGPLSGRTVHAPQRRHWASVDDRNRVHALYLRTVGGGGCEASSGSSRPEGEMVSSSFA